MKRFGTISYNLYGDFTNYGSALQTWALLKSIQSLGYDAVLIDYCPHVLLHKNPLNPLSAMQDQDKTSRMNCELSLPAIEENYCKFEHFYRNVCRISKERYTSGNIKNVIRNESTDGFVVGSDTVFNIEEFKGFDDGYFANYPVMKEHSVSYAASFGDAQFNDSTFPVLWDRLQNFKAIGIREKNMLPYVREHCHVPCAETVDPTLLLAPDDYDSITAKRQIDEPYLLYYSRRFNPAMEMYAERTAQRKGIRLVDISLRAANADKGHIMKYNAGVEEFLSLVRYASFVVTNSYHGIVFAVQYKRPAVVFLREQAGNKIRGLLELLDLRSSCMVTGAEPYKEIDYAAVHANIEKARKESKDFLRMELELL